MLFKSATGRNIFAIAASGVVMTIAASAVLFGMASSNVRENSVEQMRQIAGNSAMSIEKTLSGAMNIADMLQTMLSTTKQRGTVSREDTSQLLSSVLRDSPVALGVWTAWEPDAFDGRDSEYANKEGHDATGRFVPYWVRSNGKLQLAPLTDYTKSVLVTTISKPLILDGKVVGATGVDLALDDAHKALDAIKPMGTGFAALVTMQGNIVAHPDPALAGKSIKDAGAAADGWAELIANPGVERETVGADGETHLSIAMPVKLTEDQSWYAIVSVPKATVFANLYSMGWSAGAITLAAAALLGLFGWLISRRFINRITGVIAQTERIAAGDLNVELEDIEARDEIGDLSRSLNVLLENNRQKVQLEQQAEASRAAQEAERAERARIASAQEEEVKFAVGELASGLARLANGDMTVRLERAFTSALDEIRLNFNSSVEKLQAAMVSFSENASSIMSGSQEIRSAAESLAHRTQQQAASVEETAAALEQITTSVKDSTGRAEEAGNLVARTRAGAERSGEVVRDAVEAMSAIENSSQSISNIIGVIDEIAFQTNLLALNAGVEAARAGEAGKGFAVVAQEVRELAQRSAQAAKEIKNLITSSGEQVKRGVTLVGQAGEALQTIVAEVQEINRNVEAIVQSAREQSVGLQEINTAVNQMDQATQQNAAMVEETNAAFSSMAGEIAALSARLAQFNLGRSAVVANREAVAGKTTTSDATPAPAPAPVKKASRPVVDAASTSHTALPSPARALTGKLAAAFGGGAAAAAPEGDWEEF
jgi:methyl-accepting chemotaxis protein